MNDAKDKVVSPRIMTPPGEMPDKDLLEDIETLRSPAYRNLSRFHTERLDCLEIEARLRKLIESKSSIP